MGAVRRILWARRLLWLGAVAPFLIATPQKDITQAAQVGPLDVVRGALPIACFALSLMLARRGEARRAKVGWGEAGLMFYLGVAALSTLWSADPKSTLLKAVLLAVTYACVWRATLLYDSPRAATDAAVSVAYWIVATTAAEFFVFHSAAWSQIGYGPGAPNRLSAVYPQIGSNVLAWVCGFAAAGLLLGVGPAAARYGALRWGLLVVTLGEAVLTGTRLAVAIWAVALIAVSLATVNRRPARTMAAVAVALLGGFYVFAHQGQVTSFLTRGQGAAALSTLTGRTVLWQEALTLWRSQPWAGFGYYSGHRFLLGEHSSLASQVQDIDNTWIETLVDVGLIGLAGLAVFVVVALVRTVAARSLPERHQAFAVSTAVALLGTSFVNPTLQTTIATGVLGSAVLLAVPRVKLERSAVGRGHEHRGLSPRAVHPHGAEVVG